MNNPGTQPVIAGVILCGGLSRRMGRAKAGVELGGRSLLAHVADRLRPRVDRVIAVAAPHTPVPNDAHLDQVLIDAIPDRGPARALLAAARRIEADWLLVAAVDLPLADPTVFSSPEGEVAQVAVIDGKTQPLFALYPRTALLAIDLPGPERMMALLEQIPWQPVPVSGPRWENLNDEAALARLVAALPGVTD
ncbi:MAG: hypothetical protein COX57_00260 [Alphaproteobacteria bacterium CG_4_10_14_0_2_um_filter_63_37]|nr:MAG: hypothetical protein AUJ55_11965 [Proteobacteria bacterium CG1_02_64_396]PJA26039.1 MAG: hypothetical protein COX57_00260 [Alphaproteobacteria bacterium CG_4_10_14_0_2_um_filter_63_37]